MLFSALIRTEAFTSHSMAEEIRSIVVNYGSCLLRKNGIL